MVRMGPSTGHKGDSMMVRMAQVEESDRQQGPLGSYEARGYRLGAAIIGITGERSQQQLTLGQPSQMLKRSNAPVGSLG